MRLTAWEEERLLIFTAAELARRHRDRGLLLNAPEVVALICDAMLEAARGGASYEEVERRAVTPWRPDQALPGVPGLVAEVRLEVLMDDGARLVVLVEPLGPAGPDAPGAVRQAQRSSPSMTTSATASSSRSRNTSTRVVRVSSHYPFERVNRGSQFDRAAADGFRLDLCRPGRANAGRQARPVPSASSRFR